MQHDQVSKEGAVEARTNDEKQPRVSINGRYLRCLRQDSVTMLYGIPRKEAMLLVQSS